MTAGPPFLKRIPLGKMVPITLTTRQYTRDRGTDGSNVNVMGASITIYGPDSRTAPILENGSPTLKEAGKYLYFWNTSGLRSGTYKVVFDFTENVDGDAGRAFGILELY